MAPGPASCKVVIAHIKRLYYKQQYKQCILACESLLADGSQIVSGSTSQTSHSDMYSCSLHDSYTQYIERSRSSLQACLATHMHATCPFGHHSYRVPSTKPKFLFSKQLPRYCPVSLHLPESSAPSALRREMRLYIAVERGLVGVRWGRNRHRQL
jgi:hypothetical protein